MSLGDDVPMRPGQGRYPQTLRLAKTAAPKDSEQTYPEYNGSAYKLPIVFCDASVSSNSLGGVSRQASGAQVEAYTLNGEYYPRGTLVLVAFFNGYWVILGPAYFYPDCYRLNENLLPGGRAKATPMMYQPVTSGYTNWADDEVELSDENWHSHWGVAGEHLWAIPRRGFEVFSSGAPFHRATLQQTLSIGGTATAIITNTAGVQSGATITVRDRFMSVAGDSIAAGKVVGATIDVYNAEWIVTAAPCS